MSVGSAPSPRPSLGGRGWLTTLWRWLRLGLIAYVLLVLAAMFLENRLIFVPSPYPEGDWQPAGLAVVDAWFEAADGTQIHGWYVACPQPKAFVLFCHGNAGNISHRDWALRRLTAISGAAVLIFDYRGYGRSEGTPSEAGVLADARAARAWLARRAGVAEDQIVLLGESLGGAVAVDLAADGARGLVLESTFTSLADVGAYHYPWLPVRLFLRSRFDAISKIARYHGPLLMSHAEQDTIVPYRFGEALLAAANEPKTLLPLRGDHNDPRDETYYRRLREFFEQLPSPAKGP